MTQILIVGAGPVGLTMAAELARYGIELRIIDRAPHATETSKALALWSRTLELMDRAGVTPAFLEAGLRAHAVTIRSGGEVLGNARFDDIPSPYHYALMLPQRDTERLLADHLGSLGVNVERQVELVGFTERENEVEARLRHADGHEETMRTPWLLGCDGAHSTVRHGTGIEFIGEAQGDDWMLADICLSGAGAPAQDEVSIFLHRDGPLAVFPIPGGRARMIASIGKTDPAHPRPAPTLAEVQAMVDGRGGPDIAVSDPAWLATFRINERKVKSYRQGRVFLAGDAAHIHSPAGGQGMNTGMQDAFNLAWKLAMVQRGEAALSLLDSYSPERSAVGELVLRNATRLTDIGTLSSPLAQAARNLAMRFLLGLHAVQERLANTMSEVEIAYAESPLTQGSGAGDRLAPDRYEGAPPGTGHDPRFVLFAADAGKSAALTARYPNLIEAKPRTPFDRDRLMIVRPDGYIGLSAGYEDWAEAEAYLDRLAV
jgi:2-polyprenyl-6-methoxyphenol hydroxylase-like FAD-dependent oxidoreductase